MVRKKTIENPRPVWKNGLWLKVLFLVAFIVGGAVLMHQTGMVRFFLNRERVVAFLESLGPWSFAGFILLQISQVLVAPIPGETTGLLGGYLYGPTVGILLSTVGLTVGSFLAFSLSRVFGRPLIERVVDKKAIDRFDYLLHHKGVFLVFLLFLLPGFPKDYLCYILGLGHLSLVEFLVIASSGRLLGTVLLTLGGHFLRDQEYVRLSLLAGAALVTVIVCIAYKDRIEGWLKALHERHPGGRHGKGA